MKFWKYHGLGNDFVLVDGHHGNVEIDYDWCREKCDRHFGIGADGVLFIMPGQGSDITMRIVNADGTEAEMCGNGIRCVAKHAYDFGIVHSDTFTVMTGAGLLKATITSVNKQGKAEMVRINMGQPVIDGRSVPVDHDGRFIDQPLDVNGRTVRGSAVSMGNPHFVTFDELDESVEDVLGPEIEKHPFFPHRTNVEFCEVKNGNLYLRVYERGAAWTLACGTGACAATVAAALNGLVPFDEPVNVCLPGGWLKITVDDMLEYVMMEGPATRVFEGDTSE